MYPSRTGILKSGPGGPLPCRVLLKPTYLQFPRDPEHLDELAQLCLIRFEAKRCSVLALKGKIWGTQQYDFIGFWIIAENKLNVSIMWSYLLFLVRTLAAAFWTICSLFIKRAEQPPNKALQ